MNQMQLKELLTEIFEEKYNMNVFAAPESESPYCDEYVEFLQELASEYLQIKLSAVKFKQYLEEVNE